ncbi:MAG: hypothetical protein NXI00_12050 [Cytophagales bacterium]|nr:hypothetical protein [Cytophagales bacterium]
MSEINPYLFWKTMLKNFCLFIISCSILACQPKDTRHPIEGTWKLLNGTVVNGTDTTYTDYTIGQEMIKILNGTHFSFLRHDLTNGKDSTAIFSAGGGTYSIEGNIYTENLAYFNVREWENNSFNFEYTINGDTLTIKGIEDVPEAGVNHLNIEKYLRVKIPIK